MWRRESLLVQVTTVPNPIHDDPAPERVLLRVLATTDIHVHIHPYDYYADCPAPNLGLARIAALIEALRSETPNCLLLDNGDMLQGSPLGDFVAEVRGLAADDIHPAIAAMNALQYDAATLGNHEFNYGLDFLTRALGPARFPVVCANVAIRRGAAPLADETLLPPYIVLRRGLIDAGGAVHEIGIGIIGALPPQIMIWDRAHLSGRIHARDIVEAIAPRIEVMRAEGADVVVALCHSGIGQTEVCAGMENAATAVAALPGIDAVIAGHSHLVFPGPSFGGHPAADLVHGRLAGRPAVMPGCFGSHLGVIDLQLERAEGRWRVAGSRAEVLTAEEMGSATAHPRLLAVTEQDHLAALRHVREPVGRTLLPLTTYFGMLPGNAALTVIAEAQARHVARALSGTPYAQLPLLSATAPFKMGGRGGPGFYTDVPSGPMSVRHVSDLYPYPNTICAVLVTGAQLVDWLEHAAGIFHRIVPGLPDQPLIDTDAPSSHFDVIEGVTWEIDLSAPARFSLSGDLIHPFARRIRDLRHAGRPVDPAGQFVVVTNSYRAGGGGAFPGLRGNNIVFEEPRPNRDILIQHVAEAGTVGEARPAVWRFRPLRGTTVTFDSAPRAAAHLDSLAPLRVEAAGLAPGGFARFRLQL
jgi:2',3'-cyclic-nucleotide 2'-phosphodiesterase/3'-nucleotidase